MHVDADELTTVARRALDDPEAQVVSGSVEAVPHQRIVETTGGLYRARGTAGRARGARAWSAVLKVLVRPGSDCLDPSDWGYWRREAVVYDSDVVPARSSAGQLRRPRSLLLTERTDEIRLWMEHVPDASAARWDLSDFERVARAAGRFAGRQPAPPAGQVGQALRPFLPAVLAPGGWWATYMDPALPDGTVRDVCGQAGAWRSPEVAAVSAPTRSRVLRLWDEREALLEVLARLPEGICHNDLHRRNVLLPTASDVVAVDWGFCGTGPAGADLADLVWGTLYYGDTGVTDVDLIEQAVLGSCVRGVRETAAHVDPEGVRLAYLLATGLRWAMLLPGWIGWMLGDDSPCDPEAVFGRPVGQLRRDWARLCDLALDRADEGRALAVALGAP